MEATMTYDPNFNHGLRRDPAGYDNGPSPMGALAFMIAVLAIMGGAAFFFSTRSDNTVASNQPSAANPMQPPITQQQQRETTGSGNTAR
jgi:hypothetical protein